MTDRKKWRRCVAVAAAAALLGGCGNGIPIVSTVKEIEGYTLPQSMLVAATERNRYRDAYTDQLWQVVLDEEGTTVEAFFLEQVEEFLRELKTVNLLAEEKEIQLNGEEQGRVAQLSQEYFSGLTAEDIAYMGVTQEDVQLMYSDYCLANKLVTELTKDMDLEVSDSEAKVIDLQQIEVWDGETADSVWAMTQEEGADFAQIAREHSVNPEIDRQLARGTGEAALEEAAFALQTGEVSGVIQAGQVYYIVKCVSDYDEEATRERKAELELAKKEQVFQGIYDEFAGEHVVSFGENFWSEMEFSAGDGCTTTNFFELYREYFPEV
ncbi:peptidylprolyl isomerase [Lachnoclostridium sp. An14]|uniref:peptidyl-prolyl cis-trans isomerase n=1 Tax=Lachnoclostridium sp. An14 TaxID=1965562 RepID=UPI000B379924|nr:peptidyl-prolyl cis-trans isomerase [Lachnoclostridium sp. An14]OUQ16352.1 peptidylprolyl isomerase [Lachnoclostridium sp. An14]